MAEVHAPAERPYVDPRLLQQFKRFLYVGLEDNQYFPGSWHTHKYFEITKLLVLEAILEADPCCQDVIDIIAKTYDEGRYSRYDTIAFAMVKCLKHSNDKMKEKIYMLARHVCKTPVELLNFIFYTRLFMSGFGAGWTKAITNWYLDKSPVELAKYVTTVKSFRGLKQELIVRKSHMQIPEHKKAHSAIIKYLIYGLKKSRSYFLSCPEAEEALAYIQVVEDMRHCEDAADAVRIAATNNLCLQHVPGHFLTNMQIWEACLPNMELSTILSNLLRMHNMGFFEPNATATAVVESLLTNADYVKKSKVTPLEVFITMCCYNQKSKPTTNKKLAVMAVKTERRHRRMHREPGTNRWVWDKIPIHPKDQKHYAMDSPQNATIQAALRKTLELTWPQLNKKSSVRFLITMDMRENMFKGRHFVTKTRIEEAKTKKTKRREPAATPRQELRQAARLAAAAAEATLPAAPVAPPPSAPAGGDAPASTATATSAPKRPKHQSAECFYYKCVTPGDAALMVALSLYKREQHVTVAVFTEAGLKVLELGNKQALTLEKAKEKIRKESLGRVKVDAPMVWANNNNKQFDVFINMIDRATRCTELERDDREGRAFGGGYAEPPPAGKRDSCPARALVRYREKQKKPYARLITMSLGSHKVRTTDGSHRGVLDIIGIDEHVPAIIDAFAARLFD